jgi:hypothetical protein
MCGCKPDFAGLIGDRGVRSGLEERPVEDNCAVVGAVDGNIAAVC